MATSAPHAPFVSSRSHTRENLLAFLGVIVALGGSVIIGMTNQGLWVVGGVLAVVAGVIALLRPAAGLYFLYLSVFINLSSVLETAYGVPDLNKFLVVLVFISILANRVMMLKKPLIFGLTEIAVMLYGGVVVASLLLAPRPGAVVTEVVDWLKDFVIFLVIVQFGTEEQVWKRAQWVLIGAAAVLGMFNAYQLLTQNYGANFMGFAMTSVQSITDTVSGNRLTGPLSDPNHYGMVQSMVLPIAFYRFMTDPVPRNRMLALGACLFILVAIVGSYSRGAIVALVVVAFLMLRERRINIYKAATAVLLAVVVVTPFVPSGFFERVFSLRSLLSMDLNAQTESSLRGRSSEMIVAAQMFRDYPVLGIGRGHYAENYISYAASVGLDDRYEEREAHSLYLEVASETGILGAITFLLMIIVLLRGMKQATVGFKQINRADLIPWVNGIHYGLLAYLLASLFLHGSYFRYFWLIASLAASSSVLAQALRLRLTDSRIVSRISPIT